MTIKLIAVDMDGTFLSDKKTYNRARFQAQYEQLKELGIHFVIASGNQLYRLHAYFDDYSYDFSYVAENGAYVTAGNQDISISHLPPEQVSILYRFLESHNGMRPVICGKNSAYVLDAITEEDYALACNYYGRLKVVSSYDEIDDAVLKIALYLRDGVTDEFYATVVEALPGFMVPVTSGHQFVDLIMPGIHKAHGMQVLQQHLGVESHETAVFGDNGNDVEMLKQAGFGFAMANAVNTAAQAAGYLAGHNNEEGVLDILDRIIEGTKTGASFEQVFADCKNTN